MKIIKSVSALIVALFFAANTHAQTLQDAIKFSDNEQYNRADEAFKKLLVSDAANGDVYYYYGKNFISTDDLDSAEVMFKLGTAKAPTNPLNHIGLGSVAMHRGKKADGIALVDKGVQWSDNKSIPVFIEAAYALVNAPTKDTAKAMGYLIKARAIDLGKDNKPKNAALYIALGDVFLEANKGGDAMNNYEKAISLDKNNVRAYLRQGQLWLRARNFDSALKSYNDAIKVDSSFAPAYREKGDFYFLFDKYGLAKEQYKKYLSLAKNNFKARVRYAKFLFLAKQYNDAISEIDLIFQTDSNIVVLKRLKAYSQYEVRKYEDGLKSMNKFMAQQPADKLLASDYEYYGKLLLKNNMDSIALKVLLDVYNQDTTRKELTGDIAGAYLKTKNYAEAIKFYNIKTSLDKGVITADWLNLGLAHYQLGAFGKADTAYAKAAALQPDAAIVYLKRAQANSRMDPDSKKEWLSLFTKHTLAKLSPKRLRKTSASLPKLTYTLVLTTF
ncbi:MAG: tetratricopeptide repeat protein [Sphingobacteriales bacterium JAD_PAG50586_3]|nr:MAG: tetratricopeptide repeat protein [Sphingobacteriales bacterium JAD_PAG50586_3]